MRKARIAVVVATLALACGEKAQPPAQAPPAPSAAPAPTTPPAPPAAPAPSPAAPAAQPAPVPPAPPSPPAAPKTAAPPPASPPKAAPADEKPSAHAKVGADKCRMCHRVQHESWAASPHAAKGLDCEGCHGNGADYWPAAVMRDRARAQANGLVLPTLASCKRCHGAKVDAARFERVHAHKAR